MNTLYPLSFKPIFKEKIWGGQKIKQFLGMDTGLLPNCGEVWLLSGVDGNPTVVANGYLSGNELNELGEVFMGDLLGESVYERFGGKFPILVKVIDSNDWLSIQVHPDDTLAQKRGTGYGKTEMWYAMQADEGAQLICGFNKPMDEGTYLEYLNAGKLPEIMNYEQVDQGDVFFIPAGRVHALGPGLLIAEIQQTSDTTYRIYDWERVDDKGKPRELHTDLALEAIDYTLHPHYKTPYNKADGKAQTLVQSPFFTTNILKPATALQKNYDGLDSFVILMCTSGGCKIEGEGQNIGLKAGGVVLLPNAAKSVTIYPENDCVLLEVYIE
ncbi:MAG: class I mannose-6-phosphate isomerase [Bacteroidia bacterium]|jgi:mannose-6-phosphate isomerase|nr:class I mannose-6-phosphate isomerase [Bacteroidia bacterium]